MEVQEEIVRVLDAFADLESKLETELQAELEARWKQYTYYRDRLFDFSDGAGASWVTLNDLACFHGGHTPSSKDKELYDPAGIPWVTSKDMKSNRISDTEVHVSKKGAVSLHVIPAGATVMVVRSGILKHTLPIAILDVDSVINQDIKAVIAKDGEMKRWLGVYLNARAEHILRECKKVGGTVESLDFNKVKSMALPIPGVRDRERIMRQINECNALMNDISIGLPAEIEARRKQYAYYRDKLLTFKEKDA